MQPTSFGRMQRTSFEAMNCSVAQCLEVIGEWWSMLIIRDAFLGVRRFDDFQSRLGISRNILTTRLTSLVEAGVLDKVPYQERPLRHEYRLTDKGRDLWPVVHSLARWGDRHDAPPEGPPVLFVHRDCGGAVSDQRICEDCGAELDVRDVRAVRGPGAANRPDSVLAALLD